ncbi:MAG: PAS domain S-box protein, partial [bacterium]
MNSKKHLVSESKKPHAKSRASEVRFEPGHKDLTQALEWQRAIFESSGDAVFVSTTGWKLVEVNAAACELTGYTRAELLNLRITDLLAKEDGKPFRKNRDRFTEGETLVSEATILRKDHGNAVVEFNLRRIVVANKPYVHAVARDITARKQQEERLLQREACYRSFFEEDLTGDFISTPSGELLACNKTFARILGFDSVEEALKTNMYSVYAQEEDREAYLRLLTKKKKIENYERELTRKDKKKISVIANVSGQFDEKGRLVEIRGTIFDVTDSKRASVALRQSEERYRVAFQTSPDAVTINRLKDGLYVEINEGFTAITGYSKEDVKGKSSLELGIWHNPKDRERLVAKLRQGGQVKNFEAEFRFKDGTISTGLMSAKVMTFDGEPHILAMTRDISELKQAETALKKSELRYRALVEYMNEGLMQVDNDGVIQFVNDRFCNMVGYGQQELLGQVAINLFLLQEDKAQMEERLRLRLQKVSEQYEIRMKKKSGETILVRISGTPVVDENKRVIGSIGIHTDITDSKKIEDALNVQKAYFQQLFENSPEAIVLLDNADRVVNANQGFERLFQYRLEEITNRCINEIIVPTEMTHEASALSRAVLSKKVVQTESVRKRKDGSLVDVSVLGYPIELSEQQIGVYGIYYDITERKQAEKAMRLRFEQLETIYTLSDAVSRAEEIEEIYLKALNALEISLKADRAAILIFDADGVGRFKAWRGLSAQYRKVVEGHLPWSREDTNPQPVLVPNVEEEAGLDEFRSTILQKGIRALAFIPLKYQGRLLGKFMIYYNTNHHFNQEEVQLAQTIASHIAFALERKRTLKSLSESELRYRELVERMPDGIYRSTPEGRFLAVNSALVKMLGYESQEELLNVDIPRDLYFSPDEREALFKSVQEGTSKSIVFRLKKKDNSELWVEDHGHRVYDSQGKSLYYEG